MADGKGSAAPTQFGGTLPTGGDLAGPMEAGPRANDSGLGGDMVHGVQSAKSVPDPLGYVRTKRGK